MLGGLPEVGFISDLERLGQPHEREWSPRVRNPEQDAAPIETEKRENLIGNDPAERGESQTGLGWVIPDKVV